jgi:DNA repair exonuclease SbcCD ATPase subunit
MTDIERLDLVIDNVKKLCASLEEFRKEIGDITKLRQEHAELSTNLARIRQMLEAA